MTLFSHHPWVRRAAVAVAAVLAVWLLSWLAVPWLLKQQIEKRASEALGRTVQVGRVDFSPWSLELSLQDLRMLDAQGQAPQVAIQRIYIDADIMSVLRLAPVVDAIEVEGPVVSLAQPEAGRLDIDDILARLAQRPKEEDSKPLGFALYNIQLKGGQLQLDDQVTGVKHRLEDLSLQLPFLSSFASDREVKVAPLLAFTLNGSHFDSRAHSLPFADSRQTDVQLTIQGLDLAPYLKYLPSSLPVRLQSAVLDARLTVGFEQTPQVAVRLGGEVTARALQVQDSQGQPLFDAESVQVVLGDVRPLEQQVRLQEVVVRKPQLMVARGAQGQWLALPVSSGAVPAAQAVGKKEAVPSAWQLGLQQLRIEDGRVQWRDAAVQPAAALDAQALNLQLSDLSWPMQAPAQGRGSLQLRAAAAKEAAGSLAWHLQGRVQDGQVGLVLSGLSLDLLAPYLQQSLRATVAGQIDGQAGLAWKDTALYAQVADLRLDGARLETGRNQRWGGWRSLQVQGASVDVARRQVVVDALRLAQPQLRLERDAKGRWMYESWLVPSANPAGSAAPAAVQAPPWALQLRRLEVQDGGLELEDQHTPRPVALRVEGLQLQATDVVPQSRQAMGVQLAARLAETGSRRNRSSGSLNFRGTVQQQPLAAQGQVRLDRLPVHLLEPYVAEQLNVRVVKALAEFDGRVQYTALAAGPSLRLQGNAGLSDLYVQSSVLAQPDPKAEGAAVALAAAVPSALAANLSSEDLLRWRSLQLQGVAVTLHPGRAPVVDVRKTALDDFYARLVIQRNGRLNLQDLVKNVGAPEPDTAAGAAAPADAAPAAAAPAQAVPPVAPDPLAPRITVGPVQLNGGVVKFSDFFIQPNYSADLAELKGSLSAFSSVPPQGQEAPQMAQLALSGTAQGTASLEITGELNPLAKPLALDVQARMRDLELPPLSPYAVKYAGHGIERGKLSMDVRYKVQPDGQLTASNKLVLNQLTFGEAVPGAPASLPVKLAVALLADRNGVIDLDLPLSGSLNDPQFRVAPLVFKILGNIIRKAITAPFALLAGGFGGGDENGAVQFAPGQSQLDAQARAGLEKIAKSLVERPNLKVTIEGHASSDKEREAWKQAHLDQRLQALRSEAGEGSAGAPRAQAEHQHLKSLYRKADIEKPRNLIGLAKDLPDEEMRRLLLAQMVVPASAMDELATARAQAVRSYLAAQGVPMERLFLGASKADGKASEAGPEARIQLSLE